MSFSKNNQISFLITVLFIPLSLFSQNEKNPYYKKALLLLEKNNVAEASIILDHGIASDSTNRDCLLLKAKILYSKLDCSNSLKCLKKAIFLDKKFSDTTAVLYSDLADCLKDNSTAIEVLKDYLSKNNSDIVKLKLAQKYFLNGNYEESIVLHREYIQNNPTDIDAIIDLVRILFSVKSPDEAVTEVKKGLSNNHNNIELLAYLASCYHNMKKYDEAIKVENLIIDIDFKAEHIASRAMLYELQGKSYEAYQDHKKIIELVNCNFDYYEKILQYEFENRLYEKVIESSYSVLTCDKERESAILDGLYTSLFFCNDFQKGTYYLDKKLATKPDNFNPYYLKALTLLKSNKLENVLEYLNKALLAKDILRDNIVQVNLHKLAYFLLKEDYEGFATLWKASTLESIGNNFTITKDQKEEKIEITIDFNKKTGSINSSLKIPTKVFVMLKDKYGVELNDSK